VKVLENAAQSNDLKANVEALLNWLIAGSGSHGAVAEVLMHAIAALSKADGVPLVIVQSVFARCWEEWRLVSSYPSDDPNDMRFN